MLPAAFCISKNLFLFAAVTSATSPASPAPRLLSQLPNFDPRKVPVTGVDAHLPAVPATALTAEALRQRFLAHVDSGGGGLHPLVLQAVQAHRAVLE